MITHAIKGPKPPPLQLPKPFKHIREILSGRQMGGAPPNIARGKIPPEDFTRQYGDECMTKLAYAMWVEQEAKVRFPQGSLVTFKGAAFILNNLPHPIYRVSDIIEISFLAPIHKIYREPMALYITPLYGGGPIRQCPAALRPLNEHEVELVNTRNSQSQRTRNSGPVSDEEKQTDSTIDSGDYAG